MNKKNLHQLLFLLSLLVTQNNALNAMKRTIDLISRSETTVYPPLKKPKLVTNAAALVSGVCDKSFFDSSKLVIHERIHTGEKPFPCSFCDKSFSQKNHLTNHERTHTGEKPFSCSLCDKSFTRKNYLTNHEKTHTGEKSFSYSLCDNSFTQKGNITVHERAHTKEKIYFCSFCDKSFARKDRLVDHERTHTGEKPHFCSLCDKSFARKDNLTRHMATHAKNNAPLINSSTTDITSTRLAPLVIQKTIESKQTQKNEKVIEEAMQPLSYKDLQNWISSEKFS